MLNVQKVIVRNFGNIIFNDLAIAIASNLNLPGRRIRVV